MSPEITIAQAIADLEAGRSQEALVALREVSGFQGWDYLGTSTIPYQVPSQNVRERFHGLERKRQLDHLLKLCNAIMGQQKPVAEPRVCMIESLRVRRIRDPANLIGGAKALVDCLVYLGWLWDDDERFAHILYRQDTAGKDEPRTRITTWRVPEHLWTEEQRSAVASAPGVQPAVAARRKAQLSGKKGGTRRRKR